MHLENSKATLLCGNNFQIMFDNTQILLLTFIWTYSLLKKYFPTICVHKTSLRADPLIQKMRCTFLSTFFFIIIIKNNLCIVHFLQTYILMNNNRKVNWNK